MVDDLFVAIYQMLFEPSKFLKSLKERAQQPIFKKTYMVIMASITSLFALYISNYGYSATVWNIRSSDSLYPYRFFLDALTLFIIGVVFFELWNGLDTIFIKKALSSQEVAVQKGVLLCMNAPWLILIPYLNVMRLLWSGTYFAWGYVWIAFIHIALALAWRYWIFYRAIKEFDQKNESILILNLIVVVCLIVLALILGPAIFGGNLAVVLSQLF